MPIYRVNSDCYDKAWYVKAKNSKRAINLVIEKTETLGWHTSFPEEPRDWTVEERFTGEEEVVEDRDL